MDERGNVESSHYRLALWMIYGKQIAEVGWFGDPSLIGAEYQKASSVDNAYLQLAMQGGWLGGGLFLWMATFLLVVSLRSIRRTRGIERRIRSAIGASFAMCLACMLNTWFNPCFTHLFWLTGALTINYTRIASKETRAARGARRRRSHSGQSIQPLLAPH